MKIVCSITSALFLPFCVFAQTSANVSVSGSSIQVDSPRSSIWEQVSATITSETITEKDNQDRINGYTSTLLVEPSYRLSKKARLSVGAIYAFRHMNDYEGQSESAKERQNIDKLDTVFLKYSYQPTRFSDNGISDVRFQFRAYQDQNDIFKRRYGSDGNIQFRAYFGRPLYGKFSINRYNSYLRYKGYFVNSDSSDFTRESELRARIQPTYSPIKGLDLGLTFTYNRYQLKGNSSPAGKDYSELVDFGPSIRYQFGSYAILVWTDFDILKTDESGSLSENKKARQEGTYALALSAYL